MFSPGSEYMHKLCFCAVIHSNSKVVELPRLATLLQVLGLFWAHSLRNVLASAQNTAEKLPVWAASQLSNWSEPLDRNRVYACIPNLARTYFNKNWCTSRLLDFSIFKRKKIFLRDFIKGFEEKKNFFFKIHRNELRFKNNRQNALKPKYVVNGLLKRIWVTFDNFLKKFRGADDFFRKFWKKVIPILKIFQKVIRSEPGVRLISVNNIFRFQSILMVISV